MVMITDVKMKGTEEEDKEKCAMNVT